VAGVERVCNIFEWGREIRKVGNHWSNTYLGQHLVVNPWQ